MKVAVHCLQKDKQTKIQTTTNNNSTMECKGDGKCDIGPDGQFICTPIECPNFELCGNTFKRCLAALHDFDVSGLCLQCDLTFAPWASGKGVLPVVQVATQCHGCFRSGIDRMFLQPFCDHALCAQCVREIYNLGVDLSQFGPVLCGLERCPECGIDVHKEMKKTE